MNSQDHTVGDEPVPKNAPIWLTQLAVAVQSVDRAEFLRQIGAFTAQIEARARDAALQEARSLVAQSECERNPFPNYHNPFKREDLRHPKLHELARSKDAA